MRRLEDREGRAMDECTRRREVADTADDADVRRSTELTRGEGLEGSIWIGRFFSIQTIGWFE